MKIAIHNAFKGDNYAESELAKRLCIAAGNIGWKAIEVGSSSEIKNFDPDLVLATHFRTPKLTKYPYYGCMWNPPVCFEKEEAYIKNILSYDAYICSSEPIKVWLQDLLYNTSKKTVIAPFYPSCNETPYQPPDLQNPRLVYLGTNWDGLRFQDLFSKLELEEYVEIYGKKSGWQHLTSAYKGELPFDGMSVLNTLNKAGVGLCLHSNEHCKVAVPSMRIFEIAASGAVAICGEHDFIKENFGDSVLYLASSLSPTEKVQQIAEYINWIKDNRRNALEMSREAHRIFVEKFALEKLFLNLLPSHQETINKKGFAPLHDLDKNSSYHSQKTVQLIVRVGGRDTSKIKRALDSIAAQTYPNISIILARWNQVEGLDELLETYREKIPIEVIDIEKSGCRSTPLWRGINAVSADYFGILDDDDLIYPNHIYSLVSLLEEHQDCGVAYSGSIHVWEVDGDEDENDLQFNSQPITEPASLEHFKPFEIAEFMHLKNFITSNSFIVKSSIIDEKIRKDPRLHFLEDFFLLINLSIRTQFVFSYEATSEFYHRYSQRDNSVFEDKEKWNEAAHRIERMMWNQEFPDRQTLGRFRSMLAELERLRAQLQQTQGELERSHSQLQQTQGELARSQSQLQHALGTITAMESSKFWKLRKVWFRLKKILGLPTTE